MFFVLEGLFDNSPAIYRWVRAEATTSPGGTIESLPPDWILCR